MWDSSLKQVVATIRYLKVVGTKDGSAQAKWGGRGMVAVRAGERERERKRAKSQVKKNKRAN